MAEPAEQIADSQSTSETPGQSFLPGERETWEWMSRLADECRKARREEAKDDEWEDHHGTYWGEQWGVSLPSFKLPIVVNKLKTLILTEVSELTDTPLKIYVHKDRTQGERDANIERTLQAEWERNFVDLQVMQACLYSMIYPGAFIGCFVRENQASEKVLDVRAIHPNCVYPVPGCTSDEDWIGVMIEEVEDLVKIRRDFPERGMRVKPEEAHSIRTPEGNAGPWWQFWKRSGAGPYKGPLNAPSIGSRLQGYIKAQASKITLFVYDDATEEVPEIIKDDQGNPVLDEAGNQKLRVVTKKKYPNGRQIIAANGVILYDDAYQYYGPFPIIRIISEPTTGEFWVQTSPVAGVSDLAKAGNKMDSMVVENAIRLNNGIAVADTTTGIKPSQMASIPGQTILKGPGEFKIMYPPAMPESMTKMGSFFRSMMEDVLGYSQSRMGAGQRGNVSAELTETEISQAMGLTRLRARLLHHACTKVVQQMFYRLAQYNVMPRVTIAPDGTAIPWEPINQNKIADYLVHIDPSSFSLRSKTMVQRLVLGLAKMGKITPEYLFKMLELPDGDQEAAKLKQELQLAAQAAQLQKAQKRGKK